MKTFMSIKKKKLKTIKIIKNQQRRQNYIFKLSLYRVWKCVSLPGKQFNIHILYGYYSFRCTRT